MDGFVAAITASASYLLAQMDPALVRLGAAEEGGCFLCVG